MHLVNRNFAPLHDTLLFPETLLPYFAPLCLQCTQQKLCSLKCFEQCIFSALTGLGTDDQRPKAAASGGDHNTGQEEEEDEMADYNRDP